ncbi:MULTISPECIES: hypothetical protein [unclassified Butyricimonas]|nr:MULTISPECIES: hypothetical protein [unclassified Butyricimonas]
MSAYGVALVRSLPTGIAVYVLAVLLSFATARKRRRRSSLGMPMAAR